MSFSASDMNCEAEVLLFPWGVEGHERARSIVNWKPSGSHSSRHWLSFLLRALVQNSRSRSSAQAHQYTTNTILHLLHYAIDEVDPILVLFFTHDCHLDLCRAMSLRYLFRLDSACRAGSLASCPLHYIPRPLSSKRKSPTSPHSARDLRLLNLINDNIKTPPNHGDLGVVPRDLLSRCDGMPLQASECRGCVM